MAWASSWPRTELDTNGQFQIAGGFNVDNHLVQEIAEVLRAPLRVTAARCRLCASTIL